jgi:hypothetical protein
MKRISVDLAQFIVPHFRDLAEQYPEEHKAIGRDCARMLRMHQAYGDEYLTIHLSDAQKIFEKALSRGWYPGSQGGAADVLKFNGASGFPLRGRTFLSVFINRIFGADGKLLDTACVSSVKTVIGTLALFKKVEMPCKQEYVQDEVDQFFQIEGSLRTPSSDWIHGQFARESLVGQNMDSDPDLFGQEPRLAKLLGVAQEVADRVAASFGYLDPFAIKCKHGPRAVSDLKYGADKYSFPTWSQRLEAYFPCDHHSVHNAELFAQWSDAESGHMGREPKEAPAKLIAVPKTQKGPRLIASEPTSHMWIQQGVWRYLDDSVHSSLLRHAVNFHDQMPSRLAAQKASNDASFATVDLKSASDRLTLWTVERVFRANESLLQAFAACRTLWVRAPKSTDSQQRSVVLKKFANQGSALTFPVQSIVYAMFCIAATMYARSIKVTSRNILKVSKEITVFGDDLILPTHALPYLELLLKHNQLKVNTAKTHYNGNFAESCGFRGFKGVDVTPTYLTCVSSENPTFEDIFALVEVSNNFAKEWRFHQSKMVASLVPEKWLKRLTPTRLVSGLSLFTFSPGLPADVRVLYSKDLHRYEIVSPILWSKATVEDRDSWMSLMQFFSETVSKPSRLSYLDGPTFRKLGRRTSITTKMAVRRVPLLDRGLLSPFCQ